MSEASAPNGAPPSASLPRPAYNLVDHLLSLEKERQSVDEETVRKEDQRLISSNMILSMALTVIFIAFAVYAEDEMTRYAKGAIDFFVSHFSWFYMLLSATSFAFLLYLAFSRFGSVVLGDPEDEPEFSFLSWAAMLFSAGMGCGLLFNGVGEPINHFMNPPVGDPRSLIAARNAMVYCCLHWGFSAWAIYLLGAVSVAYFGFRRHKKYLISSAILDIAPQRWRLPIKVFADLTATLAVIFGVAASLARGVLQLASGLKYSFGIDVTTLFSSEPSTLGLGLILGVITVLYILSASTGLDAGIQFLSNLNVLMAIGLMLLILFLGETTFILKVFVDTLGTYVSALPRLSFHVAPFTPEYEKWMGTWTLVYFTWWISWTPFVGIFIARISKGRTIRELVLAGIFLPAIATVFWFAVFGGSALHIEMYSDARLGEMVLKDLAGSLFFFLGYFPLAKLTAGLSLVLILTFLVTSADSACFVIAMMTTEGDLDPSTWTKVLWGLMLSAITYVLLSSGGITATEAAALSCAFPFSIVMVAMGLSVLVRLSGQVESERI